MIISGTISMTVTSVLFLKVKLNLQLHMCYFIRELEATSRWKKRHLRFMQVVVCLMPGSYAERQSGA